MSLDNAKRLVERLTGNEQLKTQFRQAGPNSFEKVAEEQGLPCTKEEFKQALAEHVSSVDIKRVVDRAADIIGVGVGGIGIL